MKIPVIILFTLLLAAQVCISDKVVPNKYSIMSRKARNAPTKKLPPETTPNKPPKTIETGRLQEVLSLLSETIEHKHEEIFSRALNLGSGISLDNESSSLQPYFELETQIRALTTIFELTSGEWKLVNYIMRHCCLAHNVKDKLEDDRKLFEIASEIYYNFEQREDFLSDLIRDRDAEELRLGSLASGIEGEVDSLIARLTNDTEGPALKSSFLSTAKVQTYDQILERLSASESFLPESILHAQLAMRHNETLATLVGPNFVQISTSDTYETLWAKVNELLESVKTRVTSEEIKSLKKEVTKRSRGHLFGRSQ